MRIARPLFRFVLFILVALLAPAGVASAAASPPTAASGAFAYTSTTFNSTRVVGDTTIFEITATVRYTGTFDGTSTLHGILIFHADGSATFHDFETFSGTVNGKAGALTLDLAGTGAVAPAPGSFQGTDAIISGTGELANLHGVVSEVGTVQNPANGPQGSYTGQLVYDSQ